MRTALEKLRRFQVENAHHYINRLLRAAYRSGSSSVDVTARAHQTRVWFGQPAVDPSRLDRLFEELFHGEFPAARELAGATNLALSLEPRSIELRLDDGKQARLLLLQGEDEVEIEVVEVAPERPGTTFQLNRSTRSSLSALGADSPEYLAVTRRFRFSPLEIRLNEKLISREVGWGGRQRDGGRDSVNLKKNWIFGNKVNSRHHVVELRVVLEDPERNGLHLPVQLSSSLLVLSDGGSHYLDSGATASGAAAVALDFAFALGLCADSRRRSTATFVYCGETLQAFPAELALPGLDILICADGLKLDLSGEHLVQDAAFDQIWSQAKSFAGMLEQTLKAAYPGPASKYAAQAFHDPSGSWKSPLKS